MSRLACAVCPCDCARLCLRCFPPARAADRVSTCVRARRHGIPYHELHFGKPHANFYVDDLAVSAFANLHQELGIYPSTARASQARELLRAATPSDASESRTSWHLLALAAAAGAAGGALLMRQLPVVLPKLIPKLLPKLLPRGEP